MVFKFSFLSVSNIGVPYTEGVLSGAEAENCEAVHTALLLLEREREREREREADRERQSVREG